MAEIISEIRSVLRPGAKQLIKGGLVVTNALSGLATETREEMRRLVMEAKSELKESQTSRTLKAQVEAEGLWHRVIKAGHAVRDAASRMVSTANEALVTLVAWFASESKAKAQQQVQKGEEALEHLGKDLAKEESVNVVETLLLLVA